VVKDPTECHHRQAEPEDYATVTVNGPNHATARSAEHSCEHEEKADNLSNHGAKLLC
jgi:hypothetical protein